MADYEDEEQQMSDYENEQKQLELDLKELKYLQSITIRRRVYSLLSSEIDNVNSKISKLAAQPPIPMKKYNRVDSFINADQDDENIRIYLLLEGVDSEKMDSVIKPNSIDIKMHNAQGKNYRLSIPKLNKKIIPQKSSIVVMPTKVEIILAKCLKWNWSYLHLDEDNVHWNSFQPKPNSGQPGSMKLFKKIYEELRDNQTKRLIAKAWTYSGTRTIDYLKGSI